MDRRAPSRAIVSGGVSSAPFLSEGLTIEKEARNLNGSDREGQSEDEDLAPVAFKRRANGMPASRYSDEQMDALMNLIVDRRVYFKAARRKAEPPIRTKWDSVATAFFAMWPNLRPLLGPGLHKYYRNFAAAFVEFVRESGEGVQLSKWQSTLLELEQHRPSLPSAPAMRSDVDPSRHSTSGVAPVLELSNGISTVTPQQTRHASCQTEPQGAHDVAWSLQEFMRRQDQLSSALEEQLRLQHRMKEEEHRIWSIEAEARLLEARNRERELLSRAAVDTRLIELMVVIDERLHAISSWLEHRRRDDHVQRQQLSSVADESY